MGEFDVTDVIDGIKEFCSDVVEKVVNFFKGLFSNEEQQDDTETFTEPDTTAGCLPTRRTSSPQGRGHPCGQQACP